LLVISTESFKTALGSTHSSVTWERPEHETDTEDQVMMSKMGRINLHSSVRVPGFVLN